MSVPGSKACPDYVPRIYTPESFDLNWHLAKLNAAALAHGVYRRKATEMFPLLFSLLYLDDKLMDPAVSRDIHLSQFHIDMAYEAELWTERNLPPARLRQAWIAARASAKSTWLCCILPIWALAHGHRRFVAAFAANKPAAERLMRNFKHCLETYPLLREDFPELCTPATAGGRTLSDAKNMYIARSGAVFMAYGIDSNQLGANIHNMRPDLILLDDIENDEGNYSIAQKKNRLATVGSLLPMNDRAVVQWSGTTTMYGSATHDLVRWACGEAKTDWIEEYDFQPRYYPAIVTSEDGTEESMWEVKFPLDYLRSIRHTRLYALQYNNRPRSTENGLFSPADIPPVQHHRFVSGRVLRIDPSVTTRFTSDYTGLTVVGLAANVQRAVIEYSEGLRLKPDELKAIVYRLTHDNPIQVVSIEVNQGGHNWRDMLEPVLPSGCVLEEVHESVPKHSRIEELLDFCQMGWVAFADDMPELREQMLGYPAIEHDDVIDSAAGAVKRVLGHRPRPKVVAR